MNATPSPTTNAKSVPEWADTVRNHINTALQFLAINSVGDAERHLGEARDLLPEPVDPLAEKIAQTLWDDEEALFDEQSDLAKAIAKACQKHGIELAKAS